MTSNEDVKGQMRHYESACEWCRLHDGFASRTDGSEVGEARRILEGVEATAPGGVAQMLAETAESLARTARELKGISPDEWLTLEEAADFGESASLV